MDEIQVEVTESYSVENAVEDGVAEVDESDSSVENSCCLKSDTEDEDVVVDDVENVDVVVELIFVDVLDIMATVTNSQYPDNESIDEAHERSTYYCSNSVSQC